MAWRSKALARSYPFKLSETALARNEDALETTYYDCLLLLSASVSSRLGNTSVDLSSLAFERVVCSGLARFFGEGSQVLRFGWPYEIGRPEQFAEAIRWAAEKMRIRLGAGYRQPRRRDGGVDVIVWRPFPDSRPGFPIALVQCTIEEDIIAKSRDIDLGLWSSWLGFDVAPMPVLAVPGTVGRNEDWNEVALNAVLLERLRLTWLCAGSGASAPDEVGAFVSASIDAGRERFGVGL